MPINQSIWKITDSVEQIKESQLDSELELENVLQTNIELLNENWIIIGRQVLTAFNKYIDLLAIDITGSIIIIELKRNKTPRDVVAQGIDYGSWVQSLSPEELSVIFESFDKKYLHSSKSLDEAYFNKFKIKLDEDSLNSSHQIVIVAAEVDSSTERIITYLNDSNVPINIVFFKVFNIDNKKYLSRAWFIDPNETSEIATAPTSKDPWNGEYYVSFGEGENRNWNDAMKYSFISAGGGIWYSRTLNQLKPGDRVWVNIPGAVYAGVGIVTETALNANEVIIQYEGKDIPFYDLKRAANYHEKDFEDEDKAEYIVKVNWLKTVKRDAAISEVGFFGNQNTVAKPTAGKWNHTVDRLKSVWGIK